MSDSANRHGLGDILERHGLSVLAVLALFDLVVRAKLRYFWFDELLSYWIIRQPDWGTVWEGLRSGADPQPLLVFVPFRAAHALLGSGELATRSVTILAFGIAAIATHRFVRCRLGGLPALAATLVLCLSFAYYYATEARAYALMLGATALGFLSWRRAVEAGPSRILPLAVFALSMAALASTHYFAGLALAAFAAGELRRAYENRRVDWPIAAVLGLSPLALAPYIPMILEIREAYQGYSWRTGEVADMWRFYTGALAPAAIPLGLSTVVAIAIWAWTPGWTSSDKAAPGGFKPHEMWALATLAMLPIALVLLAMYATNAYAPRYALSAMFGLACLFAAALDRLLGRRRGAAAAVCLVLLASFAAFRAVPTVFELLRRGWDPGRPGYLATLDEHASDPALPVIIADPLTFLPTHYYASPALRQRLIYPHDIQAARRILGVDSPELGLKQLAPFAGYTTEPYDRFRQRRSGFYVLAEPEAEFTWLLRKLEEDGARHDVVFKSEMFDIRLYQWPEAR